MGNTRSKVKAEEASLLVSVRPSCEGKLTICSLLASRSMRFCGLNLATTLIVFGVAIMAVGGGCWWAEARVGAHGSPVGDGFGRMRGWEVIRV